MRTDLLPGGGIDFSFGLCCKFLPVTTWFQNMNFVQRLLARMRILRPNDAMTSVDKMSDSIAESGPAEMEISAMFTSIDSYVSLSALVPLKQLPELMTAYFTACSDGISAEGGLIDKFVRDAAVAMFGAPQPSEDHALRACVAALNVQRRMESLRSRLNLESEKWPVAARQIHVRIGINSGTAIVGNMGTPARFSYSMMGDEVNLAARLEAGAKAWGVWILCSGVTQRACERRQQGRVLFRSLGRTLVKGRAEPVELFEPVALAEHATDKMRACVQIFERGLERMRARDWEGATEAFAESGTLEPHQPNEKAGIKTNPSLVFADTVRTYRTQGVPATAVL